MKYKPFLILASLLVSTLGCSLPNPAPATPTRHPLPSTPILPTSQPATATASASLPDSPPSAVLDGNPETLWNSGAGPEQWIQIDLGKPTMVSAIRLFVSQYPAGETVHQIWIGADPNNMTLVHEFRGTTSDSDMLEFAPSVPLTNIRYIKIVTLQSPSWIAWREIEVIEK